MRWAEKSGECIQQGFNCSVVWISRPYHHYEYSIKQGHGNHSKLSVVFLGFNPVWIRLYCMMFIIIVRSMSENHVLWGWCNWLGCCAVIVPVWNFIIGIFRTNLFSNADDICLLHDCACHHSVACHQRQCQLEANLQTRWQDQACEDIGWKHAVDMATRLSGACYQWEM